MKKQYHFILDTTNPRELAMINYLEMYKSSRGMKSVLMVAFEVYMRGDISCASAVVPSQFALDVAAPMKDEIVNKQNSINDNDETMVSDIPDDILDLIDDFG